MSPDISVVLLSFNPIVYNSIDYLRYFYFFSLSKATTNRLLQKPISLYKTLKTTIPFWHNLLYPRIIKEIINTIKLYILKTGSHNLNNEHNLLQ